MTKPKEQRFHEELGQRLRQARKAANMTQTEAAKVLAVSQGTLQRYESGAIPVLAYDVVRLCSAYGAPVLPTLIGA